MWRILFIAILWTSLPTALRAQDQGYDWQACRGEPGAATPVLHDCRPVGGVIDPQGKELWLRAVVQRPSGDEPAALYVVGAASSEAWLNGQKLGANGRPGGSSASEAPGRYEASFPIPERMWRRADNLVVVHMSSFHGVVRLDNPVAGIAVAPYPWPSRTVPVAIAFIAAGALFAAAFGFTVIYSLRRTGSSLALAALAGVAGLQAILESLRALVPYAYPVHGLRLVGIWVLSAAFAVMLVSYVVSRFWPQARGRLILLAAAAVAATSLAPGFDLKTLLALMVGLALSIVVAAAAVRRRQPGARPILAYLAVFIGVGLLFPTWLVDLSYFLFATGLVLPLLMADVVRLGRADQAREAALTRAAARPNCLTVASSRGVERVPLGDILAVVGADDYVELQLTNGRRLLHAARLDRLEADLPASFLRVHRSVIANLAHVRGFERDGGRGRLLMQEGAPLPISRNRLPAVRDALDEPALQSA
ncbi:LytTR family DNA-binding domain-containing protein [Brevundimonas sp.]|uniref:LytR/AlgR family response regulator transcription factor n=1 Tax=Brevundimonas sp. TaxID=1871086 RepID=UPI002EDB6DF1